MSLTLKAAPLILAAAMLGPSGWAQTSPAASTGKGAAASTPSAKQQTNWRQQNMAERQKMLADLKAMDAKLQAKVDAMNRATGPAKVDAMAAVLNEIAQQHHEMIASVEAMHNRAMAMHRSATNPTMGHMQPNAPPAKSAPAKSAKPSS